MEMLNLLENKYYEEYINRTVSHLRNGGIFIYPTDTIYGIGCDIYDKNALERIISVKKRNRKKQFIILVSSLEMLNMIAYIPESAYKIINQYWPGPLTLVFPARAGLDELICDENGKIAVRMPDNKFCLDLLNKFNQPITSTSANLHNQEQSDFKSIVNTFKDEVDFFVFGGEVKSFLPSTIVEISGNELKVLRQGAIKI